MKIRTVVLADDAQIVSETPPPAPQPEPQFFWLILATVVVVPSEEDDVAGPYKINIQITTPTAAVTRRVLATIQHVAVRDVCQMSGLGQERIGSVLVENVMPLGYMTEEQFDDRPAKN